MSDKRTTDTFRVYTDAGHVIYLTRFIDDSFCVCIVEDESDQSLTITLTQADIAKLNDAIHTGDSE